MKYDMFSKQELIDRLNDIEVLNRQLLSEKNQEAYLKLPWTGNLGSWYLSLITGRFVCNPLKYKALGFEEDDIPKDPNLDFFQQLLHSDDYKKMQEAMEFHLNGKAKEYEVEYRMKTKTGQWKWFYDRGKVTQYDDKDSPHLVSGVVFDITPIKEDQSNRILEKLPFMELSRIDNLTKIMNHNGIIEELRWLIEEASSLQNDLSIALFDIDSFQEINNTYGHLIGNKVLKEVVNIINECIGPGDIIGRYGGEEFLVVFPKANYKQAFEISEKIRHRIANHIFEPNIQITVSGGVKEFNGEHYNELIHETDLNLYYAKSSGKNNVK